MFSRIFCTKNICLLAQLPRVSVCSHCLRVCLVLSRCAPSATSCVLLSCSSQYTTGRILQLFWNISGKKVLRQWNIILEKVYCCAGKTYTSQSILSLDTFPGNQWKPSPLSESPSPQRRNMSRSAQPELVHCHCDCYELS